MMAASLRKADVLFAVSALSDGYFDSEDNRSAYTEVIGNYFAESGDETEADTEYEKKNRWYVSLLRIQLDNAKYIH